MAPEDSKDLSTESSNPRVGSTLCQVCQTTISKYKCPGCYVMTCSLPCVKAHKQSTGCTGKRQLTQFVPLSEFNDNLLISDYHLLEDAKRVAESAQRKRVKLCGESLKLASPLKMLLGAAANRRTKIRFQATGMLKRQINQSFYDNRKKVISWTIEWRFHSTDVVLHNHGVDDNTSLSSVIMNHLKPGPFNHRLKQFCDEPLQSLKFFVQNFPEMQGQKSHLVELDIEAPIREQLANLAIIEYPVIHVFLPSHHHDLQVIKAAICHKLDQKKSLKNREPSPDVVLFREEDMKEENSSDPTLAFDEQLNFNVNYTLADMIDNMDPELVQGLLGSYSDLISESGLDDFFDLDGVFPDDLGLVETNDLASSCLPEEELEDGEIRE